MVSVSISYKHTKRTFNVGLFTCHHAITENYKACVLLQQCRTCTKYARSIVTIRIFNWGLCTRHRAITEYYEACVLVKQCPTCTMYVRSIGTSLLFPNDSSHAIRLLRKLWNMCTSKRMSYMYRVHTGYWYFAWYFRMCTGHAKHMLWLLLRFFALSKRFILCLFPNIAVLLWPQVHGHLFHPIVMETMV